MNIPRTADPVAAILFDSKNELIFPDSMSQTLGYDGSNNLTTITITDGISTWVQTMTYSGGNLATISKFVKQ